MRDKDLAVTIFYSNPSPFPTTPIITRSLPRQDSEPAKSLRRLTRNPLSIIGLILVLAFVGIAIFAPFIAPPAPSVRDPYLIPRDGFKSEPQPPNADHIFGTTEGQYDIFYGVIWGTRTAFLAGGI
ncbi:MAG TPA: hypothetical protein VFD70_02105, partial [Anaerolineae bacterium]|nr:hypothetical protein [Anaerolineae bacterium]